MSDAEELIASHSDGNIPWDVAGLADALAFVGGLENMPADDWPNLTPPDESAEAAEVVGALKYDLGSQLLLRLRERDPAAGMDVVLARLVRFDCVVSFIRGNAARLLADELAVQKESGSVLFAESMIRALAELPHPGGRFILEAVLARVSELEEQGGGG